jgi:hypothetical protein
MDPVVTNDNPAQVASDTETLIYLERTIRKQRLDEEFKTARSILRTYLWNKVGVEEGGSIVEAVESLATKADRSPDVAAILLRCLDIPHFMPTGGAGSQLDRSIVSIVEIGLPKICELIGVNPKSQTFEKFKKLAGAHARICELLSPLAFETGSLEGLVSAKPPITAALNHSCVMAYGHVFRLGAIRGIVDKVIHDAHQVLAARPTLLYDVEQLEITIKDGEDTADENGSFIYFDFLIPFLKQARSGLSRYIDSARGRFASKLTLGIRDGEALPKRYPLYEVDRQIQIRVPLRNKGPGLATDVRARVAVNTDKVVLGQTVIMLGDVAPGEFSLYFDVLIVSPLESFPADIEIEWGGANREADIFGVSVLAQVAGINWSALEYWHPYGTDPAEGDRFIGRAEIVRSLASRLLRTPMEPFYITGQKRVGKTSLALATVEFARKQQTPFRSRRFHLHSTILTLFAC